jgi:hypothetical protein
MAIVRGVVQRRGPARPTAAATRPAHSTADSLQAQTAHLPWSVWAFTSAPASTSNRTIRQSQFAAMCSGVSLHGRRRRRFGRRTQRPIRCKRKRRTRRRPGRARRRRHRRAIGRFGDCRIPPHGAARCGHSCARRGRGAGVGPTGVPQDPTGTRNAKQQARPEGRLCVRFG